MSEKDKIGLLANLNRVKAQDTIHRGDFDANDYRGVYQLYMTAFGDKRLAEDAKSAALERYVEDRIRAAKH